MINQQIKQDIDNCIGKNAHDCFPMLQHIYEELYPYVIQSYENSHECLQYAIGQLQRINDFAEPFLMVQAFHLLRDISHLFLSVPSPSLGYMTEWKDAEIRELLNRVAPFMQGAQHANVLNKDIAEHFSLAERQKFVCFINDSISRYGLQTRWDKDTIENQVFYLSILYSLCHKDSVMDIYYNEYYNVLDRMVSTGEPQLARDYAENLLMIGYDVNMLPYSYLGACRAYTAAKNSLAGLLYLNITLSSLRDAGNAIPQRLAFDLLWQFLKVIRESRRYSKKDTEYVAELFNNLKCKAYDSLSFNHTYFTLLLLVGDVAVVGKVNDYLNCNREAFYQNLEHSAMPWLTLISGMKMIFPDEDYTTIAVYEQALRVVVETKGNEMLFDLDQNKNLAVHLKDLLYRLQSTRNEEDYAHDNELAMIFARKLIAQASEKQNPQDFLLAMIPKSDYTFVKPAIEVEGNMKKMEVNDVDGQDCHFAYEDLNLLQVLMQAEENDVVMWIAKDSKALHDMKLVRNMFNFGDLDSFSKANVSNIQRDIISKLKYTRYIYTDHQPVYIKDHHELEEEGNELLTRLNDCRIRVPQFANRLLMAKDMAIACYPHQLLIEDGSERFIGELLPSCNIISTELLIKTNFEDQLSKDYTKTFWSPADGEEFTFEVINRNLQDIFERYKFDVCSEPVPSTPRSSDLNIICAHGGSDIGLSGWFSADGQPIKETSRIVGRGKLLLLFVCHSGTIQNTDYDNAMHTIVKRYLRMGYSSVVAPMWSLATEIIPTWLGSFMENLDAGDFVIDAVFKANMAVKEEYVAPSAWACMHLFGNPYLQISDSPRLILTT